MYYLVKFSKDWADEFDVYGFAVFKKEEWEDLYKKLKENKNEPAGSVGFGTNEGWEDETIGDFIENVEIVPISKEEKVLLKKVFGKNDFGYFPDFGNMVYMLSDEGSI